MAFRNRGGRGRGGGFRQLTDWARIAPIAPQVVAANTRVIAATAFLVAGGPSELTIRRTIGWLWIAADQTSATEQQFGVLGAYIASDNAVAAGAGSVLDPDTDRDDDVWFLWLPFMLEGRQLTTQPDNGITFPFDSKGQRRFQTGQQVVFVLVNSSATHGLRFNMAASILAGTGLTRR